ncbi:MAG: hypothetical protein AAFT19_10710 [Pseudomonadota bacterium]
MITTQLPTHDRQVDGGSGTDAMDATGMTEDFWLRRSGARPLAFSGSELCMGVSYTAGTPFWYELNIYRKTDGGFVVRLDMRAKSDNDPSRHHAWECPSFAEVMESLEAYDAGDDIRIDIEPDDPELGLADLAAHALSIRARAEEARRQYRGLIGELLHELETGA